MLIINRKNEMLWDANIVEEYIISGAIKRQKKGKPLIGNKN